MYIFGGGIEAVAESPFGIKEVIGGMMHIVDLNRKKAVLLPRQKVIDLMLDGMQIGGLELTGTTELKTERTFSGDGKVLGQINGHDIIDQGSEDPINIPKRLECGWKGNLRLCNIAKMKEWTLDNWESGFNNQYMPVTMLGDGCVVELATTTLWFRNESEKNDKISKLSNDCVYSIMLKSADNPNMGVIQESHLIVRADSDGRQRKIVEWLNDKGMSIQNDAWVNDYIKGLRGKPASNLMAKQAMLGIELKANVITNNGKLELISFGDKAVKDDKIDIRIPNGIQVIREGCITRCGRLFIPESVEEINGRLEAGVIENLPISLKTNGKLYGKLLEKDGKVMTVLELDSSNESANPELYTGIQVKNVAVLEDVNYIQCKSIKNNTNVEKLAFMSKKPITIANESLRGLANLHAVITPNAKIERIGEKAFTGNEYMQSIDISECRYIGKDAFYGAGISAVLTTNEYGNKEVKTASLVFKKSVELSEECLISNVDKVVFLGDDIKLPQPDYNGMPDIVSRNGRLEIISWDVVLYYVNANVGSKLKDYVKQIKERNRMKEERRKRYGLNKRNRIAYGDYEINYSVQKYTGLTRR